MLSKAHLTNSILKQFKMVEAMGLKIIASTLLSYFQTLLGGGGGGIETENKKTGKLVIIKPLFIFGY
jgi:hypothetical protein